MEKNKVTSLDKSGSASKTETEHIVKIGTKKRSLPLDSSDDKKYGRTRTNKHDNKNK